MKKEILILAALLIGCKEGDQKRNNEKTNTPIEENELLGEWKIDQVKIDGLDIDQQNASYIEFGAYQKYIGFDNKEYIYGIVNDSVIILDKNGERITASQILQKSEDEITLITKLADGRIVETELVKL